METFFAATPEQARIGLLAGMLALAAPAAMAQGICGNYVQVSSNAGACPQCTLFIADNPEIQKYFAEANNGWRAELTWVEGDASVAEGFGQWGDLDGPFGRQSFDIEMVEQDDMLAMRMFHHREELGVVQAAYRCTDFD